MRYNGLLIVLLLMAIVLAPLKTVSIGMNDSPNSAAFGLFAAEAPSAQSPDASAPAAQNPDDSRLAVTVVIIALWAVIAFCVVMILRKVTRLEREVEQLTAGQKGSPGATGRQS